MTQRLNEKKLQVSAQTVDMRVTPMQKAVQGAPQGQNGLQQIASALGQISPTVAAYFDNQYDNQIEQYDLDAKNRVDALDFDEDTRKLAEDMMADNNNPSYLKSMDHYRGAKLGRYAAADYAQRYSGNATNEAGDNAFYAGTDDPEGLVTQAIQEFSPEGSSGTFMAAFNQEIAKTHHQGREFFIQKLGAEHTRKKGNMRFINLDNVQKDIDTGEYLPPEEAVEALMGEKARFLAEGGTEDEWYQQMLAQATTRAHQGDTEYIKELGGMVSELGIPFSEDPVFGAKLSTLGELAVKNATEGRDVDAVEHIANLSARSSNNEVTPEELSEELSAGTITNDEFVDLSGKIARSKITAKNKSATANAKLNKHISDTRTKRAFYTDAINAWEAGDKSKVEYSEPAFFPTNQETGEQLTIKKAEAKQGLNVMMEFRLGQRMSIKNQTAKSPKDVASNFAEMIHSQAKFIASSGGKFPKWSDLLARTHAEMLDSDAQVGQITDNTSVGLQLALTLKKVNPAMYVKMTTDAQRKLFDQVAASSAVGLGELHEVSQIKKIISSVANEEATIAASGADTGDATMPEKRKAVKRLETLGVPKLKSQQIINNGLAATRGDNRPTSDKIDEIIKRTEDAKIELSDGSVIFKSPEQSVGFSAEATRYSKSNETLQVADALDAFVEKSKLFIADREPNQKVIVVQHPNNDKAYVLADEWGHPFSDASGTWLSTTDNDLAPWFGIRKRREFNLESAREGIFKQEFDKAMTAYKAGGGWGTGRFSSTQAASDKTREILEGLLDTPSKDLPDDVKGFIDKTTDAENKQIEDARSHASKIGELNRKLKATRGSSFLD